METPPCRLYAVVATHAPVALVFRRGPSDWWHLLRWDLATDELTPGAWFRGKLYPRRCDISPDGSLLGYFALTGGPDEWDTYFAVSKAPWLTALTAWQTHGTWTGWCSFDAERRLTVGAMMSTQPFHGNFPYRVTIEPLSTDWSVRDLRNELKRGWSDVQDKDRPSELPAARGEVQLLRRAHPQGRGALFLAHNGTKFSKRSVEGVQVSYAREETDGSITLLPDAAWADWDHRGRLLTATFGGELRAERRVGGRHGSEGWELVWSRDLTALTPGDRERSPDWARHW